MLCKVWPHAPCKRQTGGSRQPLEFVNQSLLLPAIIETATKTAFTLSTVADLQTAQGAVQGVAPRSQQHAASSCS